MCKYVYTVYWLHEMCGRLWSVDLDVTWESLSASRMRPGVRASQSHALVLELSVVCIVRPGASYFYSFLLTFLQTCGSL